MHAISSTLQFKKSQIGVWVLIVFFLFVSSFLQASGLHFTGPRLADQDVSKGQVKVIFDLEWYHSWRVGSRPLGQVQKIYIREPGSGYSDGTYTITFSDGNPSSQATASVTISGGEVVSVSPLNYGAGYQWSPGNFTGISTTGNVAVFDVHIAPWWDAAWVFVKYRVQGTQTWKHMKLTESGHSVGSGTPAVCVPGKIDESVPYDASSNPVTGVYFYRSQESTGTFSLSDAYLVWDYRSEGIQDDDIIEFSMHGVEMIYVPSGAFFVGSGGDEHGAFFSYGSQDPYLISNANAIQVGESTGYLMYPCSNESQCGDGLGPVPATYPNGFKAFFAMKHELTQQMQVDFLNTLAANQQNNRSRNFCSTIEAPGIAYMCPTCDVSQFFVNGTLNYISGMRWRCAVKVVSPAQINNDIPAVFETDLPKVAAQGFNWADIAAIADWASMRPLSELEFEKLARGSAKPQENEYAWGTSQINTSEFSFNNLGQDSESISSGLSQSQGNASCVPCIRRSSEFGPMRNGVFATSNSTESLPALLSMEHWI